METRLFKLILLLFLFCVILVNPARAQTGQPPCTPAHWGPSAPIPPVAVLVATHACLLAHYNPNDPSTDYSTMTWDLDQVGIAELIASPEGLPKLQRVLILNDYAFWMLQDWMQQHGNDVALVNAVQVLKLVLSLAPERGFAWLNLGDVYREEMNDPFIPGTNPFVAQTPGTQTAEARLAVAAYKHYLALVHKPSQRVVDYVAFEAAPNPKAAAAWNTNDAIYNMLKYPAAASIVLGSDNQELATLALAMDIGLLLPDAAAHKDVVNTLLRDITPSLPNNNYGFDGTAESFVPYLDQQAGNGGVRFPLTCDMVLKYPELIDATDPVWGGHRDDFNAYVDCNDAKYLLPTSVQNYVQALDGLSGDNAGGCGGTDDLAGQEALVDQFFSNIVQLAPRFFLPPYREAFDDGFDIQHFAIPPSAFPLQVWGETDIDSYTKAKALGGAFFKARSDLAAYYQSVFGLPATDAQLAALRGAWLLEDAFRWANGGTPDSLAEALLAHKPLAQVEAALKKESPAPASMLFLAVEYPEALKLVLAQQPDLTVTTPIGKTVLMEAAKYNQLESVKLLLAAGADVDAVSLAPDQINNNSDPSDPYGCWSLYNITHGSRTALMYAAANASLPVITALLAAGADPKAKDSAGATALDYLEGRGPVSKNSVLDAADFKIAALDLAGPRWRIPPPPPRRPPPAPQYTVLGSAKPWNWQTEGLNSAYPFGDHDGTEPTVLDLSDLGARPGQDVVITYLSGQDNIGPGYANTDANGIAGTQFGDQGGNGSTGAPFPSAFMSPYPINPGELVGGFTDSTGQLVEPPFAIGDGPVRETIPAKATQLQLGINDDFLSDNGGAFVVSVKAAKRIPGERENGGSVEQSSGSAPRPVPQPSPPPEQESYQRQYLRSVINL